MSSAYLSVHLREAEPVRCGNCDWCGTAIELEAISDIEERLYPGETVPAGQCPDCGALAYLLKDFEA